MKLAARSLYGSFFIQYQYTELTKLSCRRAPEGSHREYYAVYIDRAGKTYLRNQRSLFSSFWSFRNYQYLSAVFRRRRSLLVAGALHFILERTYTC